MSHALGTNVSSVVNARLAPLRPRLPDTVRSTGAPSARLVDMRLVFLGIFAVVCSAISVAAGLPPLTVKDISLMLRSGYSTAAVEREVATRRCGDAIDASAEKNLLQAGASPTLIVGLKTGVYAIPPAEVGAVQEELALKAKRRAAQEEESRRLNTLYQAQQAQARSVAVAPPAPAASSTAIASLVRGDLVTSDNGVLSPYLDQAFEKKKLIGLYFAGSWCGQCRKFTPQLVEYYNRVAAAHPEFEIVFVSADRSASAMESYMRSAQMRWPALRFEKVAGNEAIRRYAGSGVPCLVVVDASGRVISDSYAGKTYRGPSAVLAELDQLFASGSTERVALQR